MNENKKDHCGDCLDSSHDLYVLVGTSLNEVWAILDQVVVKFVCEVIYVLCEFEKGWVVFVHPELDDVGLWLEVFQFSLDVLDLLLSRQLLQVTKIVHLPRVFVQFNVVLGKLPVHVV
jgi:hypothetical protein